MERWDVPRARRRSFTSTTLAWGFRNCRLEYEVEGWKFPSVSNKIDVRSVAVYQSYPLYPSK
jgi:hypothetical protein